MEVLTASILIILLVIISNIISHYVVFLPTALIEIAIGLFATLFFDIQIVLEADWFMLLFVAPLLFNDAKHFPKKELWEMKSTILGYAILLVFITTIAGGFFVHWLIPVFPLPLAMALVAVLSPTDPVAVQSIAEQVKLPKKITTLISGESLINDASGLIAFKYALAAFMTGYFSIFEAATNFLYMALIGALIGVVLMMLIHFTKRFLVQQGIQDVVLHSTIQLLTPFIIFIIAESVHSSGVIAVVAAGIVTINQPALLKYSNSESRLVTNKMWDIVVYLLNGVVFVLLGVELPIALTEVIADPFISNVKLLLYILIIWFFLLVLRIAWSYLYLWINFKNKKHPEDTPPSFYTALLTGLTGVRGAVTMATIMSMPMLLADGSFFVERSLMIALACGVVITSLLIGSFTLPLLTNSHRKLLLSSDEVSFAEESDPSDLNTETGFLSEMKARQIMAERVIATLKDFNKGEDELVTADLIHDFQVRLKHLHEESNDTHSSLVYAEIEKETISVALDGKIQAISQLRDKTDVPLALVDKYLQLLQNKQKNIYGNWKNSLSTMFQTIQRRLFSTFLVYFFKKNEHIDRPEQMAIYKLEVAATKGAIKKLKENIQDSDKNSVGFELRKQIVNQKIHEYIYRIQRIKYSQERHADNYQEKLSEYYNIALYTERKIIHDLYSSGKISLTTANKLRQSLSYYETTIL